MITFSKQRAALFVGRSCQQWIVRDPEGNFWLLPSVENHWGQRQAFHPTAETELELVPGYYTYMFPDLHEEDIAGSGFAITGYRVHQALRGDVALVRLRERLCQCGLRLLLDFVPNLRGPGLRCGSMGSGCVCHDACHLSQWRQQGQVQPWRCGWQIAPPSAVTFGTTHIPVIPPGASAATWYGTKGQAV